MKVSVFNFCVNLVTPTRVASDDKVIALIGANDHLPEEIKPMLRQETFPRDSLSELNRIKNSVLRYLWSRAVRSRFGGWHVATGKEQEVVSRFEQFKIDFEQAKQSFLTAYHPMCRNHDIDLRNKLAGAGFDKTDELIGLIGGLRPTREYLDRNIQFDFLRPRVVEFIDEREIKVIRAGVYGQCVHEVAVKAAEAGLLKSTKARLRAIAEIAQKLDGLSYIVTGFRAVSAQIKAISEGIPFIPEKEYRADQTLAVEHVVARLADEDALAAAAESGTQLFNTSFEEEDQSQIPSLFDEQDKAEVVKQETEETIAW